MAKKTKTAHADTIRVFNAEHRYLHSSGDVLFVDRLRAAGFVDEQIATVIGIVETICTHCWENERPCYCRHDEW